MIFKAIVGFIEDMDETVQPNNFDLIKNNFAVGNPVKLEIKGKINEIFLNYKIVNNSFEYSKTKYMYVVPLMPLVCLFILSYDKCKPVAMIHPCNEVFLAFQNNVHRLDIDIFKKKENEKRKMLATEAISFKRRKLCAYEYDVTIE